jgi:hypothetical protein
MTSLYDNRTTWTCAMDTAASEHRVLRDSAKRMTHPGGHRVGPWIGAAWMRRRAELNSERDQ